MAVRPTPAERFDPRERLLESAYQLFSTRGVQSVGVDELIARAQVAKATFYRHFSSKTELVLEFLKRREQRWTREWLESGARRRGSTPEGRLLAIFDLFDGWFREPEFEGCSFVNVLLELGPEHPAGRASIAHLGNVRGVVRRFATEAHLKRPAAFARSWHLLMEGSIVKAGEGDVEAARYAKRMGRALIAAHR